MKICLPLHRYACDSSPTVSGQTKSIGENRIELSAASLSSANLLRSRKVVRLLSPQLVTEAT